jgi:hypothetical protein
MTCSSCGAEVSALDTTCRTCGTELRTPSRVASGPVRGNGPFDDDGARLADVPRPTFGPPTPPTPPAPTIGASTTPARKRMDRSTKILAIVASVAVVVALGAGVSRMQLSSKLARTEAEAAGTSSQLTAATDQTDSLQQRVGDLEVASQQLQSKLGDAQAQVTDIKKSLVACQQLFQLGAKYANGAQPPHSVAAQMASKLASCFQGEVPPSVYG